MGEDFAVWYAKFFFSNAVGGVVFRGVVTAYQAVRLMRVAQVAKGTGAFLEGAVEGGSGLGRLASLEVNVSQKGLNLIENHLNQFGEVPENIMMINRLKAAMEAGQKVSGADASFYMHEAAEATMMGQGMGYEAAHAASLAKYGVSQFSVYHPEVIQSVNALNSSFNSAWFKFWGIE
jgi:filamentous hemagglutinin